MLLSMWEEEAEKREAFWKALGEDEGYTEDDCPECGRHRLIHYSCGKTICEKCNWCVEDKDFFNWDYHIEIGKI